MRLQTILHCRLYLRDTSTILRHVDAFPLVNHDRYTPQEHCCVEEMPDVIAVRGPCRALIGRMHNDDKYRGIRSNFCAQQGLGVACGRQQEDVDNTCEVEWTEDTCYSSREHGLPGTHRDTDIHMDNSAHSNTFIRVATQTTTTISVIRVDKTEYVVDRTGSLLKI